MTWLEPGERLELNVRVDTKLRPPLDHVEPSLSELHFEPQEAGKVVLSYRFQIRARQTGSFAWPAVRLEVEAADGTRDTVEIAERPLLVHEVSKEFPGRQVFFPVRTPPPERWTGGALLPAAVGALIGGRSGARTGAAIGAGTAILTQGETVYIPRGTLVETTLSAPLLPASIHHPRRG